MTKPAFIIAAFITERVHILARVQEAFQRCALDNGVVGAEQDWLAKLVVPGAEADWGALVGIKCQLIAPKIGANSFEIGRTAYSGGLYEC